MTDSLNAQLSTSKDRLGTPGVLLFENQDVRVWECVMEPGKWCDWHFHEYPHLLVVVDGAEIYGEFADGTHSTLEIPGGFMIVMPAATQAEVARNVSVDRTLRELVVDLKRGDTDQALGMFQFFAGDQSA